MRRKNDFYPTPEWATVELLKRVLVKGQIFECCVGNAAIQSAIVGKFERVTDRLWNNDIIQAVGHLDFQLDASLKKNWEARWNHRFDWTITNPPFSRAAQIVPLAYEYSRVGIAMLLRLSFLEPVEDRGEWLNSCPPNKVIVLPRISFTGDGKTDNVTCAWMIWEKSVLAGSWIQIAENPRFVVPKQAAPQQGFGKWAGTGIMTNDIGPVGGSGENGAADLWPTRRV